MKTRRLVFLSATVITLSLASLFIFSQIDAQNNVRQLIQADFVNMLIRALGLENEFGVTATMMDKVNKLKELGLAPPGGWDMEKLLIKGDAAVVLAQILGMKLPAGATPEEYVRGLADQNIMLAGGAEEPLSQADLTTTINTAAAPSGGRPRGRAAPSGGSPPGWDNPPPYHKPVSPTGWENAAWNNK